MSDTPDTFVVMWRAGRGRPWEVQPRIYTAADSARVTRQLQHQFGGQVFTSRIHLPRLADLALGEVARD